VRRECGERISVSYYNRSLLFYFNGRESALLSEVIVALAPRGWLVFPQLGFTATLLRNDFFLICVAEGSVSAPDAILSSVTRVGAEILLN
jgi:hypothetical protein